MLSRFICPKKVLDSIKMSAKNCPCSCQNVESVVELLHIGPYSSPLPILCSHLGIENTASFHKLILSVGELKHSGYISDPREIFSLKAIQYICIPLYNGPFRAVKASRA